MGGYYAVTSMTNDPSVIMLGGVILVPCSAPPSYSRPGGPDTLPPGGRVCGLKGIRIRDHLHSLSGTIAAALTSGLTLHYTLINAAPPSSLLPLFLPEWSSFRRRP